MCGIAGAFFAPPDVERMRRALNVMRQRGPDGEGVWIEGATTLGHRRLRIMDLTGRADQPFHSRSGRTVVTFNGEIYNFHELRAELERKHGRRFRTTGDTEVLVEGYEIWGMEELLHRLDGMFALVLWDRQEQVLYLARDPFGKKPLYYSRQGRGVYVASTAPALKELLPVTPALSPEGIGLYLTWMAIPAPYSAWQGVGKLAPATWAKVTASSWDVERYHQPQYTGAFRGSRQDAELEVDRLLTQAVRKRLVADVPVGAFLSGGVDSGLVVARMAGLTDRPVETFTVGYDEGSDERDFARMVASRYGTSHHELVMTPSTASELGNRMAEVGEPLGDPSALPTFAVAQAARREVTVALNGAGGDELFAGYSRPVVMKAAQRLTWLPLGFKRSLRNWLGTAQESGAASRARRILSDVLAVAEGGVREGLRYRRAFWGREEALTAGFRRQARMIEPDTVLSDVVFRYQDADPVAQALAVDVELYLSPQLLRKVDAMTMAVSLEARSPFLDRDVAAFARSLPVSLLLPGWETKTLLKTLAERDVDPGISKRPKKGFTPPVARWLRGTLGESIVRRWRDPRLALWGALRQDAMMGSLERVRAGSRRDADAVWTALALDKWMEAEGLDTVPWAACETRDGTSAGVMEG